MAELPAYDPERLFPFAVTRDVPVPPPRSAPATAAQRFLHPRGGMAAGERVLITGIAGSLGRLLTHRLLGRYGVLGVDRNGWPGHPPDVQLHLLDLRTRQTTKVFDVSREVVTGSPAVSPDGRELVVAVLNQQADIVLARLRAPGP